MQTKSYSPSYRLPNYFTRLILGLVIVTLTLFLLVTAVDPIFTVLMIDDACETAAQESYESFSAETAVPDCWLVR